MKAVSTSPNKSSRAYCPAAISLIFRVWPNDDVLQMGSTGVGFTLDKGVAVTVSLAKKSSILFNKSSIEFPTVATVMSSLTDKPVTVQLKSELPLGVGFGLSGASALTTAFALNALLDLKKSAADLVKVAHSAEVMNKTGLGTVTTQAIGGFLIKETPGISPDYVRLPLISKKIYSIVFDQLKTNTILGKNFQEKINTAADDSLAEIKKLKSPNLSKIIDLSYEFAKNSQLLQSEKVTNTISSVRKNNGHATMHMLGEAVVSNTKKGLDQYNNVYEFRIVRDIIRLV